MSYGPSGCPDFEEKRAEMDARFDDMIERLEDMAAWLELVTADMRGEASP